MVLCCPFEFTKILVIALHWDLCLAAKCDLDGHVLEGLTYHMLNLRDVHVSGQQSRQLVSDLFSW